MGQGSTQAGRQGSTGTFQNTISPKSAEQAMLMKMDEVVDRVNALTAALAAAADVAAVNAAAAALPALTKIKLVR